MKLIPATPEAIAKRGKILARVSEAEYQKFMEMSKPQRDGYLANLERKIKGEK